MEKYALCIDCNNSGDNVLVCHPETISPDQIRKALDVRGFQMSDCYAVTPDEFQYYIIDDRLTLTPALVAQIEKMTA